MSDEEKSEPLCNIDHVLAVAKKLGLALVARESFWKMADMVESSARHIFDALTPDDKEHISLYSYVVLVKK
jgi:hypothetical protein